MKATRLLFTQAAFCSLCSWSGLVWSQPAAQPQLQIESVLREAIEAAPGQDMSISKLTVPPGYVSTTHSHPGETFAYVLSGRILNQVDDEEPRVVEAGQFFFEHANARHVRFENPDMENPAVVLIYGIRPEGSN
jgi:quercetin dioxygenase-like cupin family protein